MESDPGYRGPWLLYGPQALEQAPLPDLRALAQALRQRAQHIFQESLRLQKEIEAICLEVYGASPALRQALARSPWPDPMPALPSDRDMAAQVIHTALVDLHLEPRRSWPPEEEAHCLLGRWLRAPVRRAAPRLTPADLQRALEQTGLPLEQLEGMLGKSAWSYLEEDFWGQHLQEYRRRPRLWLWRQQGQLHALPFCLLEERRQDLSLALPPPEALARLHSRDAWRQVFGQDPEEA